MERPGNRGAGLMNLEERGLAPRGKSPAVHRGRRCARPARRDDREYREYLREEQRRRAGCSAGRMQADFHHGLPRSAGAGRRTTMGAEAACTARFKGKTASGKERLETDVLLFRGGYLRLSIPFKFVIPLRSRP